MADFFQTYMIRQDVHVINMQKFSVDTFYLYYFFVGSFLLVIFKHVAVTDVL
jgi:hypothetical protein